MQWVLEIILGITILVLAYQILIAIGGGTWPIENIIIGLLCIIMSGLFVIIGIIINLSRNLGRIEGKLGEHLRKHI